MLIALLVGAACPWLSLQKILSLTGEKYLLCADHIRGKTLPAICTPKGLTSSINPNVLLVHFTPTNTTLITRVTIGMYWMYILVIVV